MGFSLTSGVAESRRQLLLTLVDSASKADESRGRISLSPHLSFDTNHVFIEQQLGYEIKAIGEYKQIAGT